MTAATRRRVLVVGHLAGPVLGGAERSLLDMLDGFAAIGVDTVVAVPSADNEAYIESLRQRTGAVHVLPAGERRPAEPPDESLIARYVDLIASERVDAVQVNTIVPREPLIAARRAGVKAVVNVREIPHGDHDLERWLGASAEELVASVLAEADYVISVSRAAGDAFPLSGRSAVVNNAIDCDRFPVRTPEPDRAMMRVALVGSPTGRKGLYDFLDLARLLSTRVEAQFVIVGPATSDLVDEVIAGRIPAAVVHTGYVDSPQAAMAEADIVVNLSRCAESFGRTVLEAMASGLPVVAYDSGGTAEMVVDGVTGMLVPQGDVVSAARSVQRLCHDPALRTAMGTAGRARALDRFSPARLAEALSTAYRAILPPPEVEAQRAGDQVIPLHSRMCPGFERPYYAGTRARFAYTSGLRFVDDHRIVATSFIARTILTVDLATEQVITEIATDGEHEISIDLLDLLPDGRIVTANCERASFSEFELDGDRPRLVRTVPLVGDDAGFAHSAATVPGRDDLVCITVLTNNHRVVIASRADGRTVYSFGDGDWRPKAATFLDDRRMVIAWAGRPLDQDPYTPHFAKLTLVEFRDGFTDHVTLCELPLDGCSADGLSRSGTRVFMADQVHDAALEVAVDGDELRVVRHHDGFSFPHDVAVSPDGRLLAVASYGDDAVVVRPLT